MSDSTIKVQVVADENSARRAKTLISEVASEVRKLNAEMSGMTLGSRAAPGIGLMGKAGPSSTGVMPRSAAGAPMGGVGQQLSQVVKNEANVLRVIAIGTRDAMRMMSDETKRALQTQKTEFANAARAAQDYLEKVRGALGGSGTGAGISRWSAGSGRVSPTDATFVGALPQDNRGRTTPPPLDRGFGGGGSGGSGGGPTGATPSTPEARPSTDVALLSSVIARAVGQGLANGASTFQNMKGQELNFASATQQLPSRLMHGMLSGDPRDMWYLQHGKTLGGKSFSSELMKEYGGTTAANAGYLGSAISGVADSAIGIKSMIGGGRGSVTTMGDRVGFGSGVVSGGVQAIGAGVSAYHGGANVAETQKLMQGLDDERGANPLMEATFDNFQAEKHMRASASRKLMGQHQNARLSGAGYGYGFGESLAIAESLQSQAGMTGMWDSKELVRKGGMTQDSFKAGEVMWGGGGLGRKSLVIPTATYSPDEYRTNTGLHTGTMQLAGAGIDRGVGGSSLSAMHMALGGTAKTPGMALEGIQNAVARGTTQGFTDPRAQQELVSAMGAAASGSRLSGTEGLQSVAQYMSNGAEHITVAGAQARGQVMQSANTLYASNPFYQGIGVASARHQLGDGANPGAMLAMAGATTTDLVKGGQAFDDYGITKSQRLGSFRDRISGIVKGNASTDPEVMAALKNNGGDVSKLPLPMLRRVLQNTQAFGGSDEMANAAAHMFHDTSGIGDLSKVSSNKLKSFGDAAAFASISAEERAKAVLVGEEVAKGLGKWFKDLTPEKLMEKMVEQDRLEKQYDVKSGKEFLVKIIREFNEPSKTPPNPKTKR